MSRTLPNQFDQPRHDGSPMARRRVTRRGAGLSPDTDDNVPVLLRIPNLTSDGRAATDPVRPDPPSFAVDETSVVEESPTIKFVPARGATLNEIESPTADTATIPYSVSSTDSTDQSVGNDSSVESVKKSRREPATERRRRREIPPSVEHKKAVTTQWGIILLLVVVIAAAYYSFAGKSRDKQDATEQVVPATKFVPAAAEPAPALVKPAATPDSRMPHDNTPAPAVPPLANEPANAPPEADLMVEPTLDGPRHEPSNSRPRQPPAEGRQPSPPSNPNTPPDDGPLEHDGRRPASPYSYPETDPATYDYGPENLRAAPARQETDRNASVPPVARGRVEVGSARLNGIQPLPARERR